MSKPLPELVVFDKALPSLWLAIPDMEKSLDGQLKPLPPGVFVFDMPGDLYLEKP